jgi:hypothetical protein
MLTRITSAIADAGGIAVGSAGLLVGQAAGSALPADWGALIQGGAFAVLAYAFLHLIVKTLPQRDREYTDAVRDVTTRYEITINRLSEQQAAAVSALATAVVDLRVHCVTQHQRRDERDGPS